MPMMIIRGNEQGTKKKVNSSNNNNNDQERSATSLEEVESAVESAKRERRAEKAEGFRF